MPKIGRLRYLGLAAILTGCATAAPTGTAGPATPGPTTTATPGVSPLIVPESGTVAPGWYAVRTGPWATVPFTFTMPAGWVAENGGQTISKNPDTSGEVGFNPFVLTDIYADACGAVPGRLATGTTADELLAALRQQSGPHVSDPRGLMLGGQAAQQVDLTVPDELELSSCRIGAFGLQIWFVAPQDKYFVLISDGTATVTTADVGSDRFVLVSQRRTGSSAADVAELDAIVASIRFEGQ